MFTVTSPGQVIATPPDTTTTFCVQVAVFPLLSVTVHVTVVTPTGYVEGALLTVEATPQLSVATGLPKLTPLAVHKPGSVLTTTSEGHTIRGSTSSTTVTVKLHVLVFPAPSVATKVLVVVPSGNTEPLDKPAV